MFASVFKRILRNPFVKRDEGGMTVEAVLWMPVFTFALVMVADAAAIFMNQARILQVVQDANRAYVVNKITTTAGIKTEVESRISGFAPGAVATPVQSGGYIVTSVAVGAGDLDLSGISGVFSNANITISAQHLLEP